MEYYVRENSSDGNLKKVCESDRGIPVSPSSEMEIRFLRQQFPENNLIVAACEDQGFQYEPVSIVECLMTILSQYCRRFCHRFFTGPKLFKEIKEEANLDELLDHFFRPCFFSEAKKAKERFKVVVVGGSSDRWASTASVYP